MHSSFSRLYRAPWHQQTSLLQPIVEIDGNDLLAGDLDSELQNYWIPKFRKTHSDIKVEYIVFAPVDRRGFVCVLSIDNISNKEIELRVGLRGCWKSSFYTTKIKKQMSGMKEARISSWQLNCPVIEFRGEIPLFAIAFAPEFPMEISFSDGINKLNDDTNKEGLRVNAGFPLYFDFTQNLVVKPGKSR